MKLNKKELLYDIWSEQTGHAKRSNKPHPSQKRTKKLVPPHPGQSYNPEPEQHKKLLEKIAEKELEYQQKQKSIRRAIEVKVEPNELVVDAREELLAGIKHLVGNPEQHKSDGDSDTENAFSDYEDKDFEAIIKDKTVKEKRKSKQQRLRQMKDRLQRREAKLRKLKKLRLIKFDGLKKLNKELDKKDAEAALKKSRKHHKRPKEERLGQRLELADPIYCLPSDLPANLRQASCSMNAIVRDRLQSFQSRLMVEPSQFQIKKSKYKKKVFERKVADEREH